MEFLHHISTFKRESVVSWVAIFCDKSDYVYSSYTMHRSDLSRSDLLRAFGKRKYKC